MVVSNSMRFDELRKQFFGSESPSDVNEDSVFDSWNEQKKKLHKIENAPKTKRRQVWWCVVGKNVGSEQGCVEGFERPVVVIKSFGKVFWGIPITSSDPEKKKEGHPLYVKLEGISYKDTNGIEKTLEGFLSIHQMRVFDNKRLKRKILKMDIELFEKILRKIRSFL